MSEQVDMLLHRIAGATYEAIGMLYDVPPHRVRSVCRLAVKRGALTREQIGMKTVNQPLRIPEDRYNQHWIARVKARCTTNEKGCWLWPGSKNHKGYGQTGYRGKTKHVHRKMFEIVRGLALATEQIVCHRCDIRECCNPAHLWLGTVSDNALDSARKGRHWATKVKECPRGHPYDENNTYFAPNGARNCKACARARQRIAKGWPEELAYSERRVPYGYTREVIA